MAENYIQLPPNSTGEKVRSFKYTIGANDVNSQAMTLTDSNGNLLADFLSGRILVNSAATTNWGKTVSYFPVTGLGSGTNTVAAASAGNRHKVVGLALIASSSNTSIQLSSGATALTGSLSIPSTLGVFLIPMNLPNVFVQTAVNQALNLVVSSGTVNGVLQYITEP